MKKIIVGLVAATAVVTPIATTAAPAMASPRSNAIGTAKDYLRYMPFSKAGLADQLMYEGYSRKVSNYAVNHIKVNWKKQAVKSGRSYLQTMHFSCSGLIDQLEYEQFTHRQAVFGAHHTNAC